MKIRLLIPLLMFMLVLVPFAFGQGNVDGTCEAKITTQRGEQTVTIMLKAEGMKLTGSVSGGQGGSTAIENGKVEGDTVSFSTKAMGRGGEVTQKFTGNVKGDEILFTRETEGGRGPAKVEFTAKRAK